MITARDYQLDGVNSVFEDWKEFTSTLGVAATGLGKTVMFAMIIQRVLRNHFPRKVRAMVLANGRELIYQAADKIKSVTGLDCEIEMGEHRAHGGTLFGGRSQVVISTIQTQCARDCERMKKFPPDSISLLVLDEADGATSNQFQAAINYYSQNPNLKIFGCTATPKRTDEKALGKIFQSVAFNYELLWGIDNGWLVRPIPKLIHVASMDLSSVGVSAGDLNGADLAAVMEGEKPVQKITQAIFENMFSLPENSLLTVPPPEWATRVQGIRPKVTLAFASSVRHAEIMSNIFNRVIPGMASWICGETDKIERQMINKKFQAGELPLLCNFGTHTVGFDCPIIEMLALARPTSSERLAKQMLGRCTRILPGVIDGLETKDERLAAVAKSIKPNAIALDFEGINGKIKLITAIDILGGDYSDNIVSRVKDKIRKTGEGWKMTELLEEEAQLIAEEKEQRRLAEEANKKKLVYNSSYTSQIVDPFDVLQIQPVKERGWDAGKTLSEKQRAVLLKQEIDPDRRSYAQNKAILNEIFKRWNPNCTEPTFGQLQILKKRKLPTNVTKSEASKIIDDIAKREGWPNRIKHPPDVAPEPVAVGSFENENEPF